MPNDFTGINGALMCFALLNGVQPCLFNLYIHPSPYSFDIHTKQDFDVQEESVKPVNVTKKSPWPLSQLSIDNKDSFKT